MSEKIKNPQSKIKNFLSLSQINSDQLRLILDKVFELHGRQCDLLAGKTLAMIFEKPSLRTRVSFEQAMYELGGQAIVIRQDEVGLGKREAISDVARVLGGMVHGIAARVFDHNVLVQLAEFSGIPVINMLCDDEHPAQALADVMTLMQEFSPDHHDLACRKLAWIGDGNNVARSLAQISKLLGMKMMLASPAGYELTDAAQWGATQVRDPKQAVADADAVVTDTFVSMGQEAEKAKRLEAFRGYQVNDELLAAAPKHAVVLHCLPAYRGVEITDSVMDGPRSRVFREAHNRLHAQKGLLAVLLS